MLATTLFVDTDVGVFGVPTNSLAPSNVALAERDDQDPESLEMCLARSARVHTVSCLPSLNGGMDAAISILLRHLIENFICFIAAW